MVDSDDLIALFGTEFEDVEDEGEGIKKRPVSVDSQIATDQQGRRRFHGAFTGGFSAGYFNTVGSKEGFIPSSFKSSRAERANQDALKPEHYMDEDDLGEYGIAPRQLRATADFAEDKSSLKAEKRKFYAKPLEDIVTVQPARDSVGVRMLKRMGWRPGEGIGSLTSSGTKKKVYGCEIPADKHDSQVGDTPSDVPKDVDLIYFDIKNDLHGLGYKGLIQDDGVQLSEKLDISSQIKTNQRRGIKGQAFGVGAFEEEDEDIYRTDDISRYDFVLSDVPSSSNEKYRPVEEDFHPAKHRQLQRKFYAAAKLPSSFVPSHTPFSMKSGNIPTELKSLSERLNPVQRARLLGESYSVMSLVDSKDRKRLVPGASKKAGTPSVPADQQVVSLADNDDSAVEKQGHFSGDSKKRRRFEEFLSYLNKGLTMLQPVDLTEWEWDVEVEDFRKHLPDRLKSVLPTSVRKTPLAPPEISRPFAHLLKSKFTHAKHDDQAELKRGCDEDQVQAVKMKMFGLITRKKHEWHPDRQLCKKFNLPNPYPDSHLTGVPYLQKPAKKEMSVFGVEVLPSTAQELANKRAEFSQREETETENKGEVAVQKPSSTVAETAEASEEQLNLSVDLFKAIFVASSGEEESSVSSSEEDGEEGIIHKLLVTLF